MYIQITLHEAGLTTFEKVVSPNLISVFLVYRGQWSGGVVGWGGSRGGAGSQEFCRLYMPVIDILHYHWFPYPH